LTHRPEAVRAPAAAPYRAHDHPEDARVRGTQARRDDQSRRAMPNHQSGRGGGTSQIAEGCFDERGHLRVGEAPVQVIERPSQLHRAHREHAASARGGCPDHVCAVADAVGSRDESGHQRHHLTRKAARDKRVPLVADDSRDCIPGRQAGRRQPWIAARPYDRVRGGRRGQTALRGPLMLDSHQLALGLTERTEEPVVEAPVADRIDRGIPPLHDRSLTGGVAHPPIGAVGAEHQVRRLRQRAVEGVAHSLRPVLVVADREHQTVMQQRSRVPVRVNVGLVGNVDAVALQEADPGQLELRDHVVEQRLVEGPIERHLNGVHAGAKLVEALAAPTVVGLPRIDRHLDQHRGRGSRRALAHNQRNAPHGAGVRATHDLELGLVVAGDRARRDLDTIGHAPGIPEQPSGGRRCGWRGLCNRGVARAATGHAHDQAPPDPLVPPQPVHEHSVARARWRGHVQVEGLPRGDASLRGITTDHGPCVGWDLPARGARARILSLHRIGGSGGGRGRRGGCAATARTTARAEDERDGHGADGEESPAWHDVSHPREGRALGRPTIEVPLTGGVPGAAGAWADPTVGEVVLKASRS
jgi:hypothetical protein